MQTGLVFGGVAAGAGAFWFGRRALGRKARDEHTYASMFGPAEVFCIQSEDGTDVRVLFVGGGFQSATYLGERRFEPVFEYYRGFDHMFDAGFTIENILMLGGGGFSYPKHLLTSREGVCIDAVEIDPVIVKIARKHFYLGELEKAYGPKGQERLGVYTADALEFVRAAKDASYSVIINDSFDGANPQVSLLTNGALAEAKRVLKPGGLYLLNAVIGEDEQDVLQTFMDVLLEQFTYVCAIPSIDEEFAGEDNYLIVASDELYCFEGVVCSASSEA